MIERLKGIHASHKESLSEIDTQTLFVEPILQLLGWNTSDPNIVRRGNRNNRNIEKKAFDIEIFNDNQLVMILEIKSLQSPAMPDSQCLNQKGALTIVKDKKTNREEYDNKQGDGIGQIRKDCRQSPRYHSSNTVAVLTNGHSWMVFHPNFLFSLCGYIESFQYEYLKLDELSFINKLRSKISHRTLEKRK